MDSQEITILYYDADGNSCSKTIRHNVVSTVISGIKFCNVYEKVKSHIAVGDNIVLMFEPYNRYDPNAIACYWKGIHIGYITKKDIPVIMAQIAIENCSCEATVSKLLDVSVVINVPFTGLGESRKLIGAKPPKPMTEDERNEYNQFYNSSSNDESVLLRNTIKIRLAYTKKNADALKKMEALQNRGHKCEFVGYVDLDDNPLIFSKELDMPIYLQDKEIDNLILNNRSVSAFITNSVINEEEQVVELWLYVTTSPFSEKYHVPKYHRGKNKKEKKVQEKVEKMTVCIPSTDENLQLVKSILDYKLANFEDAIFFAVKDGDEAILFSEDICIMKKIENLKLRNRVLNGEDFAVAIEMSDSDLSKTIKLKLTLVSTRK